MSEPPDLADALKGLLDVAKVAIGAGADIPREEAVELLIRLLAVVEQSMPSDLQAQDPRVIRARLVLDAMRQ